MNSQAVADARANAELNGKTCLIRTPLIWLQDRFCCPKHLSVSFSIQMIVDLVPFLLKVSLFQSVMASVKTRAVHEVPHTYIPPQ